MAVLVLGCDAILAFLCYIQTYKTKKIMVVANLCNFVVSTLCCSFHIYSDFQLIFQMI